MAAGYGIDIRTCNLRGLGRFERAIIKSMQLNSMFILYLSSGIRKGCRSATGGVYANSTIPGLDTGKSHRLWYQY